MAINQKSHAYGASKSSIREIAAYGAARKAQIGAENVFDFSLGNIHGTLMPVPFNHASLKLAFGDEKGERLYQKLVATFGENKKVPIMDLREKNDPELSEVADYVYENVFLHYTMKQWGKTPDQIDKSITGRVPVFVGDADRYFPQAPHQGMPVEG